MREWVLTVLLFGCVLLCFEREMRRKERET
jgi:hypothetical protein